MKTITKVVHLNKRTSKDNTKLQFMIGVFSHWLVKRGNTAPLVAELQHRDGTISLIGTY